MQCLPHFSGVYRTLVTAVMFLIPFSLPAVAQQEDYKLQAPQGWGGETIKLPPGFAPGMQLRGKEHIRFAPGMMQPESETFFSYAFVFELNVVPELTEQVIREEFLKYYRGLCKSVSQGKVPDADLKMFALAMQRATTTDASGDKAATQYTGVLTWIEPFSTQKSQMLNLEIHTWSKGDRNYLFACVSPSETKAAVWKQLREIRQAYLLRQQKQ